MANGMIMKRLIKFGQIEMVLRLRIWFALNYTTTHSGH